MEIEILEIITKAGPGAYLSPSEIASEFLTKNQCPRVFVGRILDLLFRKMAYSSVLTRSSRKLPDGTVKMLYGLNDDGVSVYPPAPCLMNVDKRCMAMKKFPETYEDFEGLKSVVDVGGGIGAVSMIGSKYFDLPLVFKDVIGSKCFDLPLVFKDVIGSKCSKYFDLPLVFEDVIGSKYFDLPLVLKDVIGSKYFDLPLFIEDAPSYPGVEHVGGVWGDMFVGVLKEAAIFAKSICLDWSERTEEEFVFFPEGVSFQAFRVTSPHTLRFVGNIGGQSVLIVIDTGSNLNLIKEGVAQQLNLHVSSCPRIDVRVGNGDHLTCEGRCELILLDLQGHSFWVSPYVLPLMGADLVLGVQWFKQLGPVTLDYGEMTMEFKIGSQLIRLLGV